jgi:hypothetical protein
MFLEFDIVFYIFFLFFKIFEFIIQKSPNFKFDENLKNWPFFLTLLKTD